MKKKERFQSTPTKGQKTTLRTPSKGTTVGIDIVFQLLLGFPIHEAFAIEQKKQMSLKEKRKKKN